MKPATASETCLPNPGFERKFQLATWKIIKETSGSPLKDLAEAMVKELERPDLKEYQGLGHVDEAES